MKKWICRISTAFTLLAILGALGVWFNKAYLIEQWVEQRYAGRVDLFTSFPLQPSDVVMLGDSITEGGYWNEMFPAVSIKNRGIGGDITTGVLARLESITQAKPRAVFIKIGTNDITHGPGERSESYRQYREIVVRIQQSSPATDIYLQSLLPRDIAYREAVEGYNKEIRAIAEELGVRYIDLYPTFLAEDGSIRDELTGDELHLNGAGYRLWQEALEPYMAGYRVQ